MLAEERIPASDLAVFREHAAPELIAFAASPAPFEDWNRGVDAGVESTVREGVGFLDAVGESLGFVDIVFVLLGVATAYGVCERALTTEQREWREKRRAAR